MKQFLLTNEDVGNVCLSLSYMIHAGIGVGDAFSMMAEDEPNAQMKKLFADMAFEADGGASLSSVFRGTGCFPAYVCSLIEVGERTGKTENALTALAGYYTQRAQMDSRLRSALLYPAVLLTVLLAVVVILLVWVLPVFNDVYSHLGSSLTGIAGGLLALGGALRGAMPVLCVIIAAAVIFGVLLAVLPAFRGKFLAFLRRFRGDKGLWAKIYISRFAQGLTLGVSGGFTPREAGELAASLTEGSPAFEKRCGAFLSALDGGADLTEGLRVSGLLPRAECRLLEAGIKSGSSENVLAQISQRLAEESDAAIEDSLSKIEPTLVIVLCVMVGVILLTVMLPLMNIMNAIG